MALTVDVVLVISLSKNVFTGTAIVFLSIPNFHFTVAILFSFQDIFIFKKDELSDEYNEEDDHVLEPDESH